MTFVIAILACLNIISFMFKNRFFAIFFLLFGIALGTFLYISETKSDSFVGKFKFKYGLDIRGGSHLVYRADVSAIPASDLSDSMSALRDVIERRINIFGVSEPIVQVEQKSLGSSGEYRIIVELPGVTDLDKAIAMIGATPTLEFKTERPETDRDRIINSIGGKEKFESGDFDPSLLKEDPFYVNTLLTGRYLKRATVLFGGQGSGDISASVSLEFNDEGSDIFEKITSENIGKTVAIYLDGAPISAPVVRDVIKDGKAIISGNFKPEEARALAGRLNSGALPVPVELLSVNSIGATLGNESFDKGVWAGIVGLSVVALFMILWYRLPGFLAIISLVIYILLVLSIFKIFSFTITIAGIAGLILSFGMALDANILISERLKEELDKSDNLRQAVSEALARAWFSIRDSNLSSLISAVVLFWFGTTLIKGFALTLAIGIVVGMFTSIGVTKYLLLALAPQKATRFSKFFFKCGLK